MKEVLAKRGPLRATAGQPEQGPRFSTSVLEKVGSSVIVTDLAGKITYWNKRAEEMRGWKSEEVVGKPISYVIPAESRELANSIMAKIAKSGSWTGEFEAVRKDGTRFQTMSNDEALEDWNGRVVGMIEVSVDITERKQMEKRLRDSEVKFRGIAERSLDGIFTLDMGGILTYASPAFAKLFGFDQTELIGRSLTDQIPESEPESERTKLAQAFADISSGKIIDGLQIEARRRDGSPIFIWANAAPVFDEGRVVGFQGVIGDLTLRREMAKKLHDTEEMFRGIAERSFDGIFTTDAKGVYTYVSPSFAKLFGLDPSDMMGQSILERLHLRLGSEADKSRFPLIFGAVLSGKTAEAAQFEIRRVDGSTAFVEANASPVLEGGKVTGVQAVVRDITERKQMEKRLRDSELKFRGIVETSFDGMFTVDTEGRILYASPSMNRIMGYEPGEMIGLSARQLLSVSAMARFTQAFGETMRGGRQQTLQLEGMRKDGSPISLEVSASPVFDESHSVVTIQGVLRDVTELKRAEEPRKLLASIIESMPIGIVSIGLDGTIVFWNPAAQRIVGYSAKEMIGKPNSVLTPPGHVDEQARVLQNLRKAQGTSAVSFEGAWVKKDGALFDFAADAFPIRDADGKTVRFTCLFRDVTAQKADEEKIRVLQEARLRFISAATHELKTPLVSIKGYSDLAASGTLGEVSKPLAHGLEVVGRNVERMLNLIQELLEIERMDNGNVEISKEVVDLTDVVRESIDNLRPIVEGKKLEVHAVLPDVAVHVMGDRVRLNEVMDNLLVNAIKFTPEKGKLRVEVAEEAGQARVSVADTGIGISPAGLANIFEPFSKIPKSGFIDNQEVYGLYSTGLGLAVTKRLVELHGGRIWAESPGEGQGTTFIFTLPGIRSKTTLG
jgi:PAS domain S-box-containing protein